jgi:hypothetical protein
LPPDATEPGNAHSRHFLRTLDSLSDNQLALRLMDNERVR